MIKKDLTEKCGIEEDGLINVLGGLSCKRDTQPTKAQCKKCLCSKCIRGKCYFNI